MLSIGETDEELYEALRDKSQLKDKKLKKLIKYRSEYTPGFHLLSPESWCLIRLRSHDPMHPFDANTLAHEIFHLCVTILQRAGIPLREPSEEAWSYLIGFLHSEVIKAINEHNSSPKTEDHE